MPRKSSTEPGRVIGPLTAVAATDRRQYGGIVWQWRCECGEAVYGVPAHLANKAGKGELGGCRHATAKRIGRPANSLAGTRSGDLRVIDVARRERNGEFVWRCECACGMMTTVRASRLQGANPTTMCLRCAADRKKTPDGYRLRDARLKAKLTLRDVAAITGVSFQRVAQWENTIRFRDCDDIVAKIETARVQPEAE